MTKSSRVLIRRIQTIQKGMDEKNGFGAALRGWRESIAITQQELAKALGISAQYLSDLETGRRAVTEEVLFNLERIVER